VTTEGRFHDSAYDGLLDHHTVMDDSQWAFGTDFEDPLAGVDTTVADGVDAEALAAYCLMLGDDALIYSHRLSEWCSRAPDLEEDICPTTRRSRRRTRSPSSGRTGTSATCGSSSRTTATSP